MERKNSYFKDWWKDEHFSTWNQISEGWHFSLKLLRQSEVDCPQAFELSSLCTVKIVNHQVQWLKDFYQNHRVFLLKNGGLGEACVTIVSLQSFFSKMSVLQDKLEGFITLSSPGNLLTVDSQHRVKRQLLQTYSSSCKPLIPLDSHSKMCGI